MKLRSLLGGGAALTVVVLLSTPAVAELPGDRTARRIERMQEWLDLSEKQAAEVRLILQRARHNGRCRQSGDVDARRTCRRAKREAVRKELATILTQQQLETFKGLHAEHKTGRTERRQGRPHH
ncbi:MAG: hypothetical protein J4F42_08565 [Desulfurellaceae bacterium]|nr:hypothetical protein [Desulfurellaceae bacterium]